MLVRFQLIRKKEGRELTSDIFELNREVFTLDNAEQRQNSTHIIIQSPQISSSNLSDSDMIFNNTVQSKNTDVLNNLIDPSDISAAVCNDFNVTTWQSNFEPDNYAQYSSVTTDYHDSCNNTCPTTSPQILIPTNAPNVLDWLNLDIYIQDGETSNHLQINSFSNMNPNITSWEIDRNSEINVNDMAMAGELYKIGNKSLSEINSPCIGTSFDNVKMVEKYHVELEDHSNDTNNNCFAISKRKRLDDYFNDSFNNKKSKKSDYNNNFS